jgi:hypothetical protein
MDHDQAAIDADYEFSERLGREIELLGAEAIARAEKVRYVTAQVRTLNLVTGESSYALHTVRL